MGKQLLLNIHRKKIVDGFAGAGGMSIAFEKAFGRSPDVCFNHNDDAVSCHRINHPTTRHFCADAYEVDPRGATMGDEVGWFHYSPDCTHFSQASGGQPRSKKIRGLSWSGMRWAGQAKPDVISLENVVQILQWCPLIAKRDEATGRVIKLVTETVKGKKKVRQVVAEPGERVPVQQQYLIPNPKRIGETWKKFVRKLEAMGYEVQWRALVAAKLGGHTTRKRLFMIARRDGFPIVWPEQIYFEKPNGKQKAYKPAADCIDFSDLGKSVFGRKKDLAPATMRRIAKGVKKFVLDNPNPYIVNYVPKMDDDLMASSGGSPKYLAPSSIVPIAHYNGKDVVHSAAEPLRTIKAATKGGEFAVATPIIVPATHQGSDRMHSIEGSLPTITTAHRGELMLATPVLAPSTPEGKASAFMMQANDGFNVTIGRGLDESMTSITSSGSQQQLVAVSLAQLRNNCDARDVTAPIQTISAGGEHHGVIAAFLSRQFGNSVGHAADDSMGTATAGGGGKSALVECELASETENGLSVEDEAGALKVAAFLMEYYSEGGQWSALDKPLNTITTRERLALVTVIIKGDPYVIVDIRLRMLKPRELARGQDFPEDYIIDRGHDGRKFSVATQVRMIGNSVNPVMAEAFLRANAPWLAVKKAA